MKLVANGNLAMSFSISLLHQEYLLLPKGEGEGFSRNVGRTVLLPNYISLSLSFSPSYTCVSYLSFFRLRLSVGRSVCPSHFREKSLVMYIFELPFGQFGSVPVLFFFSLKEEI